jgi:segregation and condensation protein A
MDAAHTKNEYLVKMDMFEGPLDLLLYLVQKSEMDIVHLSVSRITTQYLDYLQMMKDLNIEVAGEYLYMASVLIRLKSREMLPRDERAREDEQAREEDGIYNREELIRQLCEYKKYKEAAGKLRAYENQHRDTFGRGHSEPTQEIAADDAPVLSGDVGLYDIMQAFQRVLQKSRTAEPVYRVAREEYTVYSRIESLWEVLVQKPRVRFTQLFTKDSEPLFVVVTFMAILELAKMQRISFMQKDRFSEIYVYARDTAQ